MDPTGAVGAASLTTNALESVGIPAHTAVIVGSIAGVAVLAVAAGAHIMPYLPVADASSPKGYQWLYGALARVTGSYGNNSPMPEGMPAGGIVPTPPMLKVH